MPLNSEPIFLCICRGAGRHERKDNLADALAGFPHIPFVDELCSHSRSWKRFGILRTGPANAKAKFAAGFTCLIPVAAILVALAAVTWESSF